MTKIAAKDAEIPNYFEKTLFHELLHAAMGDTLNHEKYTGTTQAEYDAWEARVWDTDWGRTMRQMGIELGLTNPNNSNWTHWI